MIQPIDLLVGGTTDSSGAFISPVLKPVPTLWGALKAVIQAGGSGRWAVVVAGTSKAYGRGERIDIPILVQPSQSVQIQLTGASPNTPVIGVLTGVGGTTLDEVAPYVSLVPNTISLDTFQSRQSLYPINTVPTSPNQPSFTCGAGAIVFPKFIVPAGTVAIRILANAAGLAFTYQLLVTGHQSVQQYFGSATAPGSSTPVPQPAFPLTIPIEIDWDTQLDLAISGDASNAIQFFVSALFSVEAAGQVGAASSVATPVPQPWQAPTLFASINLSAAGGGGTATVLAAPGGRVLNYLHGWSLGQDGANAAGRIQQLIGGLVAVDCDTNSTRTMNVWGDHKGMSTAGAVTVANQGVGASFVAANQDYAQA